MHSEVRAPDLSSQQFSLVGGRLLPSTNRVAAQFMYQREDGARVTLYTRHGAWDNDTTSFRYTRIDNTGVFYWIDGSMGYALVGDIERTQLLALSEVVYQHLHQ
jgi:anti-sigma factor RsiW